MKKFSEFLFEAKFDNRRIDVPSPPEDLDVDKYTIIKMMLKAYKRPPALSKEDMETMKRNGYPVLVGAIPINHPPTQKTIEAYLDGVPKHLFHLFWVVLSLAADAFDVFDDDMLVEYGSAKQISDKAKDVWWDAAISSGVEFESFMSERAFQQCVDGLFYAYQMKKTNLYPWEFVRCLRYYKEDGGFKKTARRMESFNLN